jgi:hypothetical protein
MNKNAKCPKRQTASGNYFFFFLDRSEGEARLLNEGCCSLEVLSGDFNSAIRMEREIILMLLPEAQNLLP